MGNSIDLSAGFVPKKAAPPPPASSADASQIDLSAGFVPKSQLGAQNPAEASAAAGKEAEEQYFNREVGAPVGYGGALKQALGAGQPSPAEASNISGPGDQGGPTGSRFLNEAIHSIADPILRGITGHEGFTTPEKLTPVQPTGETGWQRAGSVAEGLANIGAVGTPIAQVSQKLGQGRLAEAAGAATPTAAMLLGGKIGGLLGEMRGRPPAPPGARAPVDLPMPEEQPMLSRAAQPGEALKANNVSVAAMKQQAAEIGVVPNVGQLSPGSKFASFAEMTGKRGVFGAGSKLAAIDEANRAKIGEHIDALKADIGDPSLMPDTQSQGAKLKADLAADFDRLKAQSHNAYADLEYLKDRVPGVDRRALQEWAKQRLYHRDAEGKLVDTFNDPDALPALRTGLAAGKMPERVMRGQGRLGGQPGPGEGGAVISAEILRREPAMQAPLEVGNRVPGIDGSVGTLKTPEGDLQHVYRVVDAADLQPSHDPQTFAENPNYPEGVQERAYHTDREAQYRVVEQTQKFDPAFVVNSNPDAVNGPPIIAPDGTVLGGNSRAMTIARIYGEAEGKAAGAYKAKLIEQAEQYGLDPKEVAAMKQPVLVRQLTEPLGSVDDARRLGSLLNKSFTGARTGNQAAVSAGLSITPATLGEIGERMAQMGPETTLREFFERWPQRTLDLMQRDGLFTDRERPSFVDQRDAGITDEGKRFFERALTGSIVRDVGLMDRSLPWVLGRVAIGAADLAKLAGRADAWDITPAVRQALREYVQMQATGLNLETYLGQRGMFSDRVINPAVAAVMRALAEKPSVFRQMARRFGADAALDVPGQPVLGGAQPDPLESFNQVFKANVDRGAYNEATSGVRESEAQNATNTGRPAEGNQVERQAAYNALIDQVQAWHENGVARRIYLQHRSKSMRLTPQQRAEAAAELAEIHRQVPVMHNNGL